MSQYIMPNLFVKDAFVGWKDVCKNSSIGRSRLAFQDKKAALPNPISCLCVQFSKLII